MLRRLGVLAAVLSLPLTGAAGIASPAAAMPPAPTPANAPPAHSEPAASLSRLAAEIGNALRGSTAKHVDYRVAVSGRGTISHDATRATAPASNEKLFTTITLMDLVGPEFRYATRVSGTSTIAADGTLHGDLVLRGSGDPTVTIASLRTMAKHLHEKGLRHVAGRLIVDDTRYSHVTRVDGWKHKFVPGQSGTVDAFTVDDNEWRGGASFERDPTIDNATLWRHALNKAHITVSGRTTIEPSPSGLHRLLTHHSPDLAAIVDDTLTNSVNFNAEMMLREAGAQQSGHGSPATGVSAVHSVATALGLPLGTMFDGSGLSYSDRESPATIVTWLRTLKTLSFYSRIYFALPLSCDTGTLEGRLCGPNVRGRVRAKTGTLDHNTALSGYTTTRSGRAVTFSFLLSGFKDKRFSKVMGKVNSAVVAIVKNG
jgi:D-alanyl-D-alanine carboxypeptidase/D-alanyl-D-alanine-endopeptidase (penicillin-binding protein 4)